MPRLERACAGKALEPRRTVGPRHRVARGQLAAAGPDASLFCHEAQLKEVRYREGFDLACRQRACQGGCGRGEDEPAVQFRVVQRLHAESIPHEVQSKGGVVPKGEGEHAAQAGKEAVDLPGMVTVQ